MDEQSYLEGARRANLALLQYAMSELRGHGKTDEAGAVEWLRERQEIVSALRELCDEHGDNDWPDDLDLSDVIRNHLSPHLSRSGA